MRRIVLIFVSLFSGVLGLPRASGQPVTSPGGDVVQVWTSELLELASRKADEAERTSLASIPLTSFRTTLKDDGPPSEVRWRAWPDDDAPPSELKPLIRHLLRQEGLPDELLAVPFVESGFNRFAESPKGARGLWQLMPDTARRFGLNTHGRFDERVDPVRSTVAAARYLKELYGRWKDWSLALAAYNAGEGRVQQAIDASGYRSFWRLSALGLLPPETRAYVPAVLRRAPQMPGARK